MGDRSSGETAQRQTVWRQGGNAIKVQMESLLPDLSKLIKAKRIKERFLCMCSYLALKPFHIQTHIFRQGLLLKQRQNNYFTGCKYVL
jgi:hypothetical protein